MFNKNQILSARVVLVFIMIVGMLGVMPEPVNAEALSGSISGTVYDTDGTPIPNISVYALGNNYFGQGACTDNFGNYTLPNVPFGLSVYVYAGGNYWCGENNYALQFWPGTSNLNNASLLSVSAQDPDMPDKDFILDTIPLASPDPFMRAWYMDDIIEADNWPDGTPLTLQIEDMTTPTSPDYSTETTMSGSITQINLKGQFDVKPGMFVILSGASLTRIMMVDNLTITNINQDLDTITGTTVPNNWLWMYFEPSCTPTCRSTVANESGIWMMDYSVPGSEGQPVADIGPGSAGTIHVPSGNGSTSVFWFVPITLNLNSIAANDGWVLESSENSNIGGTLNTKANTFDLGDDRANKQYLGVLHFDTSSLPDTAVITSVTLKVLKQGKNGTDPFTTHGDLVVDIQKPYFGTTEGLVVGDFQATSGHSTVATFGLPPVSNWYSAIMNGAGYAYVNLTGTTQFRLRFTLDDNNDRGADYIKFYSGDAAVANRPQLVIQYYIP